MLPLLTRSHAQQVPDVGAAGRGGEDLAILLARQVELPRAVRGEGILQQDFSVAHRWDFSSLVQGTERGRPR